MTSRLLLSILLLAAAVPAAAQQRGRLPRPSLAPAEGPSAEPASPAGDRLTAFGLSVTGGSGEVIVQNVLSPSEAWTLGLRAGDILLHLGGVDVREPGEASRALADWKPETRLWAVVRRGRSISALESELPGLGLAASRGPEALSPMELELQRRHVEEARAAEPSVVGSLPTPHLDIGPGQRTWVRFPAGLPAGLKAGDIVEGVVATGLAADADLDYLAVTPKSRVWAEVAQASALDGVRSLRLHFFKLHLAGGHPYPLSARVVDVTGDRLLTQVSPGGTLVTAEAGLAPETRLQIELLASLRLYEAPPYYRAGVGLWIKQRGEGPQRLMEVSHVIAGRAADRAGIQAGDVLYAIDGAATGRMDFAEALDRLYGPQGSTVHLRVRRGEATVQGSMALARGVRWQQSVGIDVDWRARGPGLLIRDVSPDSPAAKAGLKAGDRLLRLGASAVEDVPRQKLKEALSRDLKGDDEVTVRNADGLERTLSLERGDARTNIAAPYKS